MCIICWFNSSKTVSKDIYDIYGLFMVSTACISGYGNQIQNIISWICYRPQIRPNTGFFKQLIKYEEWLFGEASVKMVYCEAIDKEIPDVYEPEYRVMTWFRQRYGPIDKN